MPRLIAQLFAALGFLSLLTLWPGTLAAADGLRQFLLQDIAVFEPVEALADDWFSDSELRYDLNENGDYSLALRFVPGSGKRSEAERQVQLLMIERQRQQTLRGQGRDLLQRYLQLLELVMLQAKLQDWQAESNLNALRLRFLRSQIHSESFKAGDLQQAELRQDLIRRQIPLLRLQRQSLLSNLDSRSASLFEVLLETWEKELVDWPDMRGAIEVNATLDRVAAGQSIEHTALRLAREQLKAERAERSRWFDFVEVKMRELDSGEQEASLALSVPLGSRSLNLVQRRLAVERADFELRAGLQRRHLQLQQQRRELEWTHQQVLVERRRRESLQRQLSRLQGLQQPELEFVLQSELLRVEAQLRRFRIRGMETYLTLLQEQGVLLRQPLMNWMRRDQPLL